MAAKARVFRASASISTTTARVFRASASIAGATARVFRAEAAISSDLTANAGPDQAGLNAFDVVQLTAAGSSGSVTERAWVQSSGPPVDLMGPDTETPWFVAPPSLTAQTYGFDLTVGDGTFDDGPDTVTIAVIPHAVWAYQGAGLVGMSFGAY